MRIELKLFLVGILASFLFFSLNLTKFTYAQTSTYSSENQLRNEKVQQNRENVQQRMEQTIQRRIEKKATIESRLNERKTQLIRSFWGRLIARLEALVGRLEKLIARIQSRIEKIKQTNPDIDTAKIENELNEAVTILSNAKEKIDNADAKIEEVLSSNNPRLAFQEVRGIIQDIKMDLVETHRKLVHIIGEIKGLRVGQGEEGEITPILTPTPTASPTVSESI